MRCSLLAAVAVLCVGCIPLDMGEPLMPRNECADPLPCPEGDPAERFATCELFQCTQVQCDAPTGTRVCSRCWRLPMYRSAVQGGSMWSDGVKWRVCDDSGLTRARGDADERGIPACQVQCEAGFCPSPDGEPLPQCEAP